MRVRCCSDDQTRHFCTLGSNDSVTAICRTHKTSKTTYYCIRKALAVIGQPRALPCNCSIPCTASYKGAKSRGANQNAGKNNCQII